MAPKKFVPINLKPGKWQGYNQTRTWHLVKDKEQPLHNPPLSISKKAQDIIIIHNQSNRCYWCCVPLIPGKIHIDHIHPKVFGGTDHIHNLRAVCTKCNEIKGATYPSDFAIYIVGGNFHRRAHKNHFEIISTWVRPVYRRPYYDAKTGHIFNRIA